MRSRSPHRTRRSIVEHNGETLPAQEDPAPSSDFSQEELDLEMVVVCAGEFVKEVFISSFLLYETNRRRVLKVLRPRQSRL